MKKTTISYLFFLAALSPMSFLGSSICAASNTSFMHDDTSPFSEIDNARFRKIQEYREACPHNHGLELHANKATASIVILKQEEFDKMVASRNDKNRMENSLKQFGFAQLDDNYYVIHQKPHPNQVPRLSSFWSDLRKKLPHHEVYKIVSTEIPLLCANDLYQWSMAGYENQFSKSNWTKNTALPSLVVPHYLEDYYYEPLKKANTEVELRNVFSMRANQFTPAVGALYTQELGDRFGANVQTITGQELEEKFNLVHEVGKGSNDRPYVSILKWEPQSNHASSLPKVLITGKGVCFDTGGYNIKLAPDDMEKDKWGAGQVLAIARGVMEKNLPINLTAACGWVINDVSGSATHPFDIYSVNTEWGKRITIEQKNTDAEGRIVQAGLLSRLATKDYDLVITFQTLTGAQLTAVGSKTAAFYAPDHLVDPLKDSFKKEGDPMWQLPFDEDVANSLKEGTSADIKTLAGSEAGSIQGATFMREFVEDKDTYIHFDIASACRTTQSYGLRGTVDFLEKFARNYKAKPETITIPTDVNE